VGLFPPETAPMRALDPDDGEAEKGRRHLGWLALSHHASNPSNNRSPDCRGAQSHVHNARRLSNCGRQLGSKLAAEVHQVVRSWVPPAWLAHHSMPDVAASTEPNTVQPHACSLLPRASQGARKVPPSLRPLVSAARRPISSRSLQAASRNLGRVCLETGLGCLVVVDGAPFRVLTWQHPWPTLGGRGGTWR
jgi:hypothetical protein